MDTNGGFHTNTETNEGDRGGWMGEGREKSHCVLKRSLFCFSKIGSPNFFYSTAPLLSIRNCGGKEGRCDIDSPAMIRPRTHAFFTHWFCGCNSDICTRSAMTSAAWQWQSLPPLWNQCSFSSSQRLKRRSLSPATGIQHTPNKIPSVAVLCNSLIIGYGLQRWR
jgi:hypothetical protein